MLSIELYSSSELRRSVAKRAKDYRLSTNLTQEGLSSRSGVSLGSIKRFERTGLIALESLIKIAMALGCADGFDALFRRKEFSTIQDVISANTVPKRVRGGLK